MSEINETAPTGDDKRNLTSDELQKKIEDRVSEENILVQKAEVVFNKIEHSYFGSKVPFLVKELDSRDLELVSFFMKTLYFIPYTLILILLTRYLDKVKDQYYLGMLSYIFVLTSIIDIIWGFYMFSFSSKKIFPFYLIFSFIRNFFNLAYFILTIFHNLNLILFVLMVLFAGASLGIEFLFVFYLKHTCYNTNVSQNVTDVAKPEIKPDHEIV